MQQLRSLAAALWPGAGAGGHDAAEDARRAVRRERKPLLGDGAARDEWEEEEEVGEEGEEGRAMADEAAGGGVRGAGSDDEEISPLASKAVVRRKGSDDGDAADQDAEVGDDAATPEREVEVTLLQHAALSTYWFGWACLWLPLFTVIIPLQILQIAGDQNKGSSLGTTLLLGSLSSLVCAPLFGSLSDTCTARLGRRRPFVIAGTVLSTLALLVMSLSPSLGWFSMAFLVLSISNNMILAPCSALLPDVVPREQRGVASGWVGGLSMMGSLCGGLLSYQIDTLGIFGAYMVLMAVNVTSTAITVYFVKETPFTRARPITCLQRFNSFFSPFQNHDFRVVFFTRFLIQMGILTVQEYLQYYLKDAIGPYYDLNGARVAETPEKAVSILFVPVLLGALSSSLVSGFISDKYGGRRKIIVYISSAMMAVACVFFSVTRSFAFDMLLGLVFGLGYGAFSVIDWAMATDVLPSEADFAKDMGIWTLALVLPQVIAAPVAGNLLDYFERIGPQFHVGYSMIFLLAVVYYAAGSYYVRYVEKVK